MIQLFKEISNLTGHFERLRYLKIFWHNNEYKEREKKSHEKPTEKTLKEIDRILKGISIK